MLVAVVVVVLIVVIVVGPLRAVLNRRAVRHASHVLATYQAYQDALSAAQLKISAEATPDDTSLVRAAAVALDREEASRLRSLASEMSRPATFDPRVWSLYDAVRSALLAVAAARLDEASAVVNTPQGDQAIAAYDAAQQLVYTAADELNRWVNATRLPSPAPAHVTLRSADPIIAALTRSAPSAGSRSR